MPIIHDLRCTDCGTIFHDIAVEPGCYPDCPRCGGPRTWVPSRLKTDLYGQPQWCEASGEYHASTRDRERRMREEGFEPSGDKVHGARIRRELKNTVFSYAGQTHRS